MSREIEAASIETFCFVSIHTMVGRRSRVSTKPALSPTAYSAASRTELLTCSRLANDARRQRCEAPDTAVLFDQAQLWGATYEGGVCAAVDLPLGR